MVSLRFMPRDPRFFELFRADGHNLRSAAAELAELLDAYDRVDERIRRIQELEHAGDEIGDDIAAKLDEAFITPFDREDIHELTVRLDDVVDGIQATAETFVIYDIERPTEEARGLARILSEQAEALLSALRKLDGLKHLEDDLVRVHELEHEADTLSRAAVARLFRDGTAALDVIKWRDLYREMENSIDAAEDAAEAIEKMYHKAT